MFTIRRALATYSRTTINPSRFAPTAPTLFIPKSLVMLSTPQNLPDVIESSIEAHNNGLLVLVAAIDTIVPNSHRNGVSELWSDESFTVGSSVLLDERDDLHKGPGELDGINVVTARKNWKTIKSNLALNLEHLHVDLKLANTVFSTGNLVTLYYFGPGENSGHTLCELAVKMKMFEKPPTMEVTDNLTALYETGEDRFTITESVGNVIKAIDGKSASGFLQNNDLLMGIASKETEVYVKVFPKEGGELKYQVVAGGGGWGSKASRLVLSPHAKISKGDGISFYMLTPEAKLTKPDEDVKKFPKGVIFESSFLETGYGAEGEDEVVLEGIFGCGCEGGVYVDGVEHGSAGERILLREKE